MPRRTPQKIREAVEHEMEIRWAYLLRNPEFQKDLDGVREELKEPNSEKEATTVLDSKYIQMQRKWRIESFSSDLVDRLLSSNPLSGEVDEGFPKYPAVGNPVEAISSYDESTLTPARYGPGPYITITADLSYPVDILIPLIQEEIETAHPYHRKRRHHRDKDTFKLNVYDLARQRVPFFVIADKLKTRPSTVKSAFLVACRNIFGNKSHPSKRRLLVDTMLELHNCQQCPTCSKAKNIAEFCPEAQAYYEG